jgi:hypothetical protein
MGAAFVSKIAASGENSGMTAGETDTGQARLRIWIGDNKDLVERWLSVN